MAAPAAPAVHLLRYVLHVIPHLTPLLVILGAILVVWPIWGEGYPWGSDTWGHLHRANYMLETMREYGAVDGFFKSAWMTDWYMGDPTRVYYPPLTAWVLGILSWITGDVFVAYRVFVTGVLMLLGLGVYAAGMRWSNHRWLALIGAILAITAPYTLRTIFAEGNLPRALVILTLPWLLWGSQAMLEEKHVSRIFVMLTLLWAVALVGHVMQAAIFAIVVLLFVTGLTFSNVYIPLRRMWLVLIPIGLGGVLAAFYLLPAYSHLELANVPYLPDAKIDIFSIDLNAFAPQIGLETLHIGSVAFVMALAFAVLRGTSNQRVLLFTAALTILLAFGPASLIYRVMPLNQMMLPERFLNAAVIMIPLSIAAGTQLRGRGWHAVILIGLGVVLLTDFIPAWRMVHLRDIPTDEQQIGQVLANEPLMGRIASLTEPGVTAPQIYLTSENSNHDNISGWGLENTPHQNALRRLLAGLERSPQYVERMLALWQADYVITSPETGQWSADFDRVAITPTLTLWERRTTSPPARIVPDNRMLVIGDNATSWLFAFPFATEGHSDNVQDYTDTDLSHYSVIGLNRFGGAPEALYDWVAEGNTLITDLSGYNPILDTGYTLFGIQSIAVALQEAAVVRAAEELDALPETFAPDLPWVGATYLGLDEVFASIEHRGRVYPLIGRQRIGEGSVWYIGFNLLYWLDISGQQAARAQIVDMILADSTADRSLALPPLPVSEWTQQPDEVSFNVTVAESTRAVMSMTYFPRWQATINGEPVALFNHENLAGIELAPGLNRVRLTYQPYSLVSLAGAALSGLSLAAMTVIAIWLYRHPLLAKEDREQSFFDRHADHALPPPPVESAFTICPNCGYEQAHALSPTAESYPFVVINCPQCGYDDY